MEETRRQSFAAVESISPPALPTSTESTRSDVTLKGSTIHTPYAAPMTPAYPFPRMEAAFSSPLASPNVSKQFQPFTALSPTVEPPSVKLAKAKLAQDFKASGHMQLAISGGPESSVGIVPPSPPNTLKLAIEIQTEPGLQGWWNGVCRVARESFGAERATLAVPSDITDIENVPWVQLGTYRSAEEDVLSKMTNDRTSDRSTLTEVSSRLKSSRLSDQSGAKNANSPQIPSEQEISQTKTGHPSRLDVRPKLESRHSYAGYPLKESASQRESRASLKRPRYTRASNSAAAVDQQKEPIELNAEALEKHDQAYSGKFLDDSIQFERAIGRVLDVVQPLENEADALIDGSGIFKVVHRGSPILLTRQYREVADEVRRERAAAKEVLAKRGPAKSHPKSRPAAGPRAKSQMAKSNLRTLEESPEKGSLEVAYEDYEQIPASPWSQSPAPSPAGRHETDENPFFPPAGSVDESAFDENVALRTDREQTNNDQIPAIGTDKAATIIQIPLIHPDYRISQRTWKPVERRRNTGAVEDGRSNRSASASTMSRKLDESVNSEDRYKRTPVAILSLLVPFVPYPIYLTNSLIEISPLLATSFILARQHTNMANRIESLSRKRRTATGMASEISLTTDQSDSQFFVDRAFDDGSGYQRAVSPTSAGSLASDRSKQPGSPSETPADGSGLPVTPGLVAAEVRRPVGVKTPKTPAALMEMNESYFVVEPAKESAKTEVPKAKSDKTAGTATKLTAVKTDARKVDDKAKSRLHSQGASFAATHPALPTATASLQTAEAAPSDISRPDSSPYASIQTHTPLQPGNNMLRTMIDNGATQQWIAAGHDGSIIWANAKFLVYRQSSGEELDAEFWDSILPKERQGFRNEWSKALQTGEQFAQSCRLKRFNGQYRWFHVRIIPIKDRHGATKFFHGQAMDIHEQHEAEQSALKTKMYRTSEAKYRALANSLPVIIFAAHVPAGVTFANTQWFSYSGQSTEEALGFGFLDHVHPDDLKKCQFPGLDGTIPQHSPVSGTRGSLHRQDSGTSTTSSHDSDGTNATEITARPRQSPDEEQNRNIGLESELLRRLTDDGTVICETDGQGNLSITTELRLKSKTGEYRWHVVSGSFMDSVNFGNGEAQWFIACTDITTQKLTEARMQDAKVALEEANYKLAQEVKSKMSYLSSMSHEIRTPLNGIIGNLQFLINTGLAEEAYDWAHGAKDAATNMSELINDILDLSKAEANMLKLSAHGFSPREITENVLDQLNSRTAEKKLELSAEFDQRIPMFVRGDSGRIRQVLLNLVNNAVKFTQRGEIWISCDVMQFTPYDLPELGENERYIRWKVQDTGKGFSDKDKELLFKEYSQIKRRSDKDIGGTGLGLILCKTMVELHGGRIDATGEPGKGATFQFFGRFKLRSSKPRTKHSTARSADILQQKPLTPLSAVSGVPRSPSLVSVESGSSPKAVQSGFVRSGAAGSVAAIAPVGPASPPVNKNTPVANPRLPVTSSLTSPAVSSAGSSILSGASTTFAHSIRSTSSVSVNEARAAAMNLRLPDSIGSFSEGSNKTSQSVDGFEPSIEGSTPSVQSVAFRPPMYSILLYCPVDNARRIMTDQINYVVPKSVPCQVKAEADLEQALALLSGQDAVTFTHVVVRTTHDAEAVEFVDRVVASFEHIHTALVLITNQMQLRAIKELRPSISTRNAQGLEQLIVLQRPCHTSKLCKVFDPLKENESNVEDPLTIKRKEEKRLQKESYALFKDVLGGRGLRILAVEDNRVQMNVLTNFLAKICGLEVVCAWNGQECLDLLFSHPPGYYSAIVSDIEMPLIGGYEMMRRIRAWEREMGHSPIPTVSLSANTVKEGWFASAEAGFTHFSAKPVNFRNLGYVLLEITKPGAPHVLLSDRPLPKVVSGEPDESSEESEQE